MYAQPENGIGITILKRFAVKYDYVGTSYEVGAVGNNSTRTSQEVFSDGAV